MTILADFFSKKTMPYITELPLAIPIFVLPAGVVTEQELAVINKLNEKILQIDTSKDFMAACNDKKLSCSTQIEAQFIPFQDFNDFIKYFHVLNLTTHFAFHDFYTIVVLIDYVANLDVAKIQNHLNALVPKKERIIYFLHNYPVDDIAASPEFYPLLQNYSLSTTTKTITDFVISHIFDAVKCSERFKNLNGKSNKFAHHYESDILYAFHLVSHDPDLIVKAIEEFSKSSDGSPEMTAAICELHALIDERYKGLIKPLSKSMLELSPWPLGETDPQVFCSFSAACGAYMKCNKFLKAVDCALHALKMQPKITIDRSVLGIICNHITDDMDYRSWAMINILQQTNNPHKAALVAYKIGQAFNKYEPIDGQYKKWIDFMIESIRIFHNQNAKGIELKSIFSKILSQILESGLTIPLYPSNKLFIEIFAAQGPYLPPNIQDDLNRFLRIPSNNNTNYTFNFPFTVVACEPIPPQTSIQLPKTSNSVFIYNGVSSKDKNLVIPVGSPQRILATIHNPYQIPVTISYLLTPGEGLQSERYNTVIKESSDVEVYCSITALTEGTFTISTLTMYMFDIPNEIKLPAPITFKAVANAPSFTVRTDLPNNKTIEAYDGENITFHVWILNTSSRIEITEMSLQFKPDVIAHVSCSARDVILEPFEERSFTVTVVANTQMKNIWFSIVCTTSSHVTSSMSIDRPIEVVPGIIIHSIYPLPLVPEVPLTPQSPSIVFLAVELLNSSSEALVITFSFDRSAGDFPGGFIGSEKMTGAIAGNGNNYVFLLAAGREELAECINNFTDHPRAAALRSHVETLTNKKLTSNEFKVVRKQAAVGAFFEKHLFLQWSSANGRSGNIDMRLLRPEKSVIELIEAENVTASLKVVNQHGKVIQPDKIPSCTDIFFVVETSKCASSCSIMMFNEPSVVWEDSLTIEENSNEFRFKLYFIEQNTYNFTVRFSVDSREKNTPFSVTVV